MVRRIRKAVFPVAGLGTRFLPATKAVPKEMLTLVDRPLIQYAVEEARAAGIEEFIFVTARGKGALEDYFDRNAELERTLQAQGKTDLLEAVRGSVIASGSIAHVRQHEALGLGHAVWCARHLVGDEPFAVILPDDVVQSEIPCLKQMVDIYSQTGGSIMAAMEVPQDRIQNYGVLDIEGGREDLMRVKGMVEKPAPGNAPSNLAVIGRYILTPGVMGYLNQQKRGAGGEIQLTDAIARQIGGPDPVHGYLFHGRRFDCGSKSGYLQATVAFALERAELAGEMEEFMREALFHRQDLSNAAE